MKICFIPIDNRPVCYNLAVDIASVDENIELLIPPRKYLGDLTKAADTNSLLQWLKEIPHADAIVLSTDTLIYGGLIPSRRGKETKEEIFEKLKIIKQILKEKNAEIYAFSSIMRISNNNVNEEEKDYWKDYGTKIFEYSYKTHAGLNTNDINIPKNILDDYLATRERNFEVNKQLLEWQKEGLFNTLIFSKDDCAQYGFNVQEATELEKLGGKTKTGADEIPLSLFSRVLKKEIKFFVNYTEPEHKNKISNYEDISIEKSVLGQLELGGFTVVDNENDADAILIVNNFINKQGEHVMGWDTEEFNKQFKIPDKPYAIADVRYANGADNSFTTQVLNNINLKNFYGYSAWNTSANTLGSLLACIKTKWNAKTYNDYNFKKLQTIRFLDDWAYQANVRQQIKSVCEIKEKMQPYENKIFSILDFYPQKDIQYSFPWKRKFEVEITL